MRDPLQHKHTLPLLLCSVSSSRYHIAQHWPGSSSTEETTIRVGNTEGRSISYSLANRCCLYRTSVRNSNYQWQPVELEI